MRPKWTSRFSRCGTIGPSREQRARASKSIEAVANDRVESKPSAAAPDLPTRRSMNSILAAFAADHRGETRTTNEEARPNAEASFQEAVDSRRAERARTASKHEEARRSEEHSTRTEEDSVEE